MCSCLQNSMDCWLRLLLSSAFCFIPRSNRNAYHLAFSGRTIRSSIFVYVGFSCLSFLVCLWYRMQGEGLCLESWSIIAVMISHVKRRREWHCTLVSFPRPSVVFSTYTTVLVPFVRVSHCLLFSTPPKSISRSSMHGFCCFRGRLNAYRIKNIEVKFDSPRLMRPNCTDPL